MWYKGFFLKIEDQAVFPASKILAIKPAIKNTASQVPLIILHVRVTKCKASIWTILLDSACRINDKFQYLKKKTRFNRSYETIWNKYRPQETALQFQFQRTDIINIRYIKTYILHYAAICKIQWFSMLISMLPFIYASLSSFAYFTFINSLEMLLFYNI